METNLTVEQAIEHLHEMADRLEEMQKKYPNAKYKGVLLSLNGGKLREARWNGDGIGYWSINGQEIWIDISFTTENEEEEDFSS